MMEICRWLQRSWIKSIELSYNLFFRIKRKIDFEYLIYEVGYFLNDFVKISKNLLFSMRDELFLSIIVSISVSFSIAYSAFRSFTSSFLVIAFILFCWFVKFLGHSEYRDSKSSRRPDFLLYSMSDRDQQRILNMTRWENFRIPHCWENSEIKDFSIVKDEVRFRDWLPNCFWKGDSWNFLDDISLFCQKDFNYISLICLEIPSEIYMGNNYNYIFDIKNGLVSDLISSKNIPVDPEYESHEELINFGKVWEEITYGQKYGFDSTRKKKYSFIKDHLFHPKHCHHAGIFAAARQLDCSTFLSLYNLGFLKFLRRFVPSLEMIFRDEESYNSCKYYFTLFLRIEFILKRIAKIQPKNVVLFCNKDVSDFVKILADSNFGTDNYIGCSECSYRSGDINGFSEFELSPRRNRESDSILHYSMVPNNLKNFKSNWISKNNYSYSRSNYKELFQKIVSGTMEKNEKALLLSNNQSGIGDSVENHDCEWMGVKAFPLTKPSD